MRNNKIKSDYTKISEGIFSRIEKNPILGKPLILFADFFFYLLRKLILFSRNKSGNLIIISFHRLGDTVFTIPAVREIFKHYENYNKKILCFTESKIIYELVFKDEIIVLDKMDFKYGRIAVSEARKYLQSLQPEIIFDLTGAINSASLIFNSRASQIIGMNERIFKNIYSSYTRIRKKPHLIDLYLDVARLALHIENSTSIYEFDTYYNPQDIIIIHPFAFRPAKEWNLTKFISLARHLKENFNIEIIAPKDALNEDTKEEITKIGIPYTITENMENLIEKIKTCSLFISNDSGPLYIANLLGKATFTIYGPTNPDYSHPFGKAHAYIRKKIKCSPINTQYCYTLGGIYCPSYDCMNFLTVDEVSNKVDEFLNELGIIPKIEIANVKNK